MMGLHMGGHVVGATKTCEGYTWRLTRNATKKHTSYTGNVTKTLNLIFVKTLSTPWHGAVDQDWSRKMCVPKFTSCPPDGSALALLNLPSQSGKGAS